MDLKKVLGCIVDIDSENGLVTVDVRKYAEKMSISFPFVEIMCNYEEQPNSETEESCQYPTDNGLSDIAPNCKHGLDMCPMSVINRNCDTCRVDKA